jgi:hypothetical protein
MKEGLAALTAFVKVVMAYRPDRKNQTKPTKKHRSAPDHKRDAKNPSRDK